MGRVRLGKPPGAGMTDDLFASAAEMAEERAGILEFDGLLTREEAERLGKLESEEWRHACEVRHIVAMASVSERREYLGMVEKRRGKEAGDKLRDSVSREWLRQKERKAA